MDLNKGQICTSCGEYASWHKFTPMATCKLGYMDECIPCRQARGQHEHDKVDSINRAAEKRRDIRNKKSKSRRVRNQALADGRLVKPSQCSCCDSTDDIGALCLDLSKPLVVTWLCIRCIVDTRNAEKLLG